MYMLEMQASPKPLRPLALSTDILNEQVFQCCPSLGDDAPEFNYQVMEASSTIMPNVNEQVNQCYASLDDRATEFDHPVLEASSTPPVQEQPEHLKNISKWKEQVNQHGSFLMSAQREALLPPGMLDKILKEVEEKSTRKLKFLAYNNIIRHYCESKNDVTMRHFPQVFYQSHFLSINMNAGDSDMKRLEIHVMINSKLNSIALSRMTKVLYF